MFNRPHFDPVVSGNTYTWEVRDLPWIEEEDYGPELQTLAPRLGITYRLARPAPSMPASISWSAVSTWLAALAAPAAEVTPAVSAKAAELTAGLSDPAAKIRRIADFVQQVVYVSIQMNVTAGGGYTPHAATEVLAHNYGDCKDKAALMQALLKAAGIDSFLLTLYSGDRRFVQPQWPSSQQFNHAIIAVRISDREKFAAITSHPVFGRLLVFDPTDSDTMVGDLPEEEQGSFALLLARDNGALIQLPVLPAEANRIESRYNAQVGPNGRMTADVVRTYFGQPASRLRSVYRHQDQSEFRQYFEKILSARLGAVAINSLAAKDVEDESIQLKLNFDASRFGQFLQERLLVLTPGSLALGSDYLFAAKDRKTPVRLSPTLRRDTVALEIPEGFAVDEMPDPVHMKGAFGSYEARWRAEAGKVLMEQSVEIPEAEVPAADYPALRQFFDAIAARRNSAVVLIRR